MFATKEEIIYYLNLRKSLAEALSDNFNAIPGYKPEGLQKYADIFYENYKIKMLYTDLWTLNI